MAAAWEPFREQGPGTICLPAAWRASRGKRHIRSPGGALARSLGAPKLPVRAGDAAAEGAPGRLGSARLGWRRWRPPGPLRGERPRLQSAGRRRGRGAGLERRSCRPSRPPPPPPPASFPADVKAACPQQGLLPASHCQEEPQRGSQERTPRRSAAEWGPPPPQGESRAETHARPGHPAATPRRAGPAPSLLPPPVPARPVAGLQVARSESVSE